MAEFDIVDLTQPAPVDAGTATTVTGQSAGLTVGALDSSAVAAELEQLRADLTQHLADSKDGLRLTKLTVRLTLSAEGKIAFIAKGAAEASIEVVFSTTSSADD